MQVFETEKGVEGARATNTKQRRGGSEAASRYSGEYTLETTRVLGSHGQDVMLLQKQLYSELSCRRK